MNYYFSYIRAYINLDTLQKQVKQKKKMKYCRRTHRKIPLIYHFKNRQNDIINVFMGM